MSTPVSGIKPSPVASSRSPLTAPATQAYISFLLAFRGESSSTVLCGILSISMNRGCDLRTPSPLPAGASRGSSRPLSPAMLRRTSTGNLIYAFEEECELVRKVEVESAVTCTRLAGDTAHPGLVVAPAGESSTALCFVRLLRSPVGPGILRQGCGRSHQALQPLTKKSKPRYLQSICDSRRGYSRPQKKRNSRRWREAASLPEPLSPTA